MAQNVLNIAQNPLGQVQVGANWWVEHTIAANEVEPWLGEAGVWDALMVCGITNGVSLAWIGDGWDTMRQLSQLTNKEISDVDKRLQDLPNNQGSYRMKGAASSNMKTLVYWLQERKD